MTFTRGDTYKFKFQRKNFNGEVIDIEGSNNEYEETDINIENADGGGE